MDTIFALSSGQPPAAIAVMRISGPGAFRVARTLAGPLPSDRTAGVRSLRDAQGAILDRALVLAFPGPRTATGEDLVELHLHGGRAVVRAVEQTLLDHPGLRRAEPGEFTRRALGNGVIDLLQAEGLADLLEAETEAQRRHAIAMSEGALSKRVRGWLDELAAVSALVEASLDFSDEDDVDAADLGVIRDHVARVRRGLDATLAAGPISRLRDGLTVVFAGPPNAGKSSLFNAMIGREAAIVTPVAGTTRDVLEATIMRAGYPFRLVDTAGVRDQTDDPIERIGIERARQAVTSGDIVLWLGDRELAPPSAIAVLAKADQTKRKEDGAIATSVLWSDSIDALWDVVTERADDLMPRPGDTLATDLQRESLTNVASALEGFDLVDDLLLAAEQLRVARRDLSRLLGVGATEIMLDALFGRFCVGK